MSFLYPQFLFGLAALAIPIIIHLFNFRRTKKIYFSSTHFLKHVKEASSSKLKVKHFLILASRLLFIFFLVMIFAQPFLPAEEEGLNTESVYIYLDNSLSMSNEVDPDLNALDAGLSYINEITNLYPAGTQYKLLTNDFAPFSSTLKSKDEIQELTTEIQLSGVSRSFDDVYKRLKSGNVQEATGEVDIYWISDLQRSTLGEIEDITLDTLDNFHLVPLNFEATNNVFVDSIYLENPFLIGNEQLKLKVDIRNQSNATVDDLILKVFVDEVQSGTASVNIEANRTATAEFDLAFNLNEINACRISFEEFPVTFDNDFFFTLDLAEKISVLEIKNTNDQTSVELVYGNETVFDFKSFPISNLDYNLINSSDLVIVNGLPQIDASLSVFLNQYVDNFGNLMVIPSSSVDLASYQNLVGNVRLTPVDTTYNLELSTPDLNNPFFQNVFEQSARSFAMPGATKVWDWGTDRSALLSFKDGQPFLSTFRTKGTMYLLAAPLIDDYSGFHRHAVFVPVMYRIAALSAKKNSQLYYSLNNPLIRLKMDSIEQESIFKLANQNEELIPSQRVLGNEVLLQVPRYAVSSGFYDLNLNDSKRKVLAFNTDKEESLLSQIDIEEFFSTAKNVSNVTVFESGSVNEFSTEIKERYQGTPLWKYALILALFFLLVEVLLIRFLK
ncbi:MAG: BatA domain-containing protein [Bacteroidota bacterium]